MNSVIFNLKKITLRILWKSRLFHKIYYSFFSSKRKAVVSETLNELELLEKFSETERFLFNKEKLSAIVTHAYKTVPYYKDIFDSLEIDVNNPKDFHKIPILTKNMVKKNIRELLSLDYKSEKLLKRFTGGSTGQPMEFYSDKFAAEIDNAHHWYLYRLMGYKKPDVILGCYGRSIPTNLQKKNVFWQRKLQDSVFGHYVFSSLYLNENTISFYIKKLMELKPAIIRGYPSFLNTLAVHIINENIQLDFNVKGINLTAELCNEEQRSNIERAFGTMIYLEYGHKEISVFCYSKDNTYQYYSSPAYCYVEILNDDNSATPVGKIGKVVTTGYCNYGMPFIRYNTGDLAEVAQRNGGIVILNHIVGRMQDYLLDSTGTRINLIGAIYTHKLKAFKKIKNWQLRQSIQGKVDVLLVREPDFTTTDEAEIMSLFKTFKKLEFTFKYVDHIEKTKAGKQLFVVQNIHHDNSNTE